MFQEEMSKYLRPLDIPGQLKESMLYSVEAGGKMLRPVLLIASYEVYNRDVNKALSTAIALEMMHTYSLIHDDIPARDNDGYRIGKGTNHKDDDEAARIMAGAGMLTGR